MPKTSGHYEEDPIEKARRALERAAERYAGHGLLHDFTPNPYRTELLKAACAYASVTEARPTPTKRKARAAKGGA